MGQTDGVEDKGVGWHSNPALSVRPPQELVTLMFKDRCPEDTLLAVTDRTGHHTIMAPDAGGKSVHEGTKVFHHSSKFFKEGIPFLRPVSNDSVNHFASAGRFIL